MTKRKSANLDAPIWFDGTNINETLFCDEFLSSRKIIFADGAFFTPDGRVTDDLPLRGEIYEELKCCAVNNIPRKITNILEVMKLAAHIGDFVPEADRIHLANGTLKLDGSFTEGRPNIVRSRLPVAYRPDAPAPVRWLSFLDGLLYAEDIPTLQEFIGYCLIPSNKGQRKMDLERKGKQSYQGWMFARLLAFSNGDLQALYDRSDGFYRRQLVLTTKEKPAGRIDDPDLAEKMKAEVEGIFLWAFEGLQRLVANNFKFTESQRTRDNREAVKRDSNNVFDFLESEGYIRLKADCTISSKDLYEIYRMWCEENNLTPLKRRSFSDSVIANQSKYNLEYCNKITNAAGRRVWGFFGIEAIARPNINGFSDVSERTYVPEDWR